MSDPGAKPVIPYNEPSTPRQGGGKLFGWILFIGLAVLLFLLVRRQGPGRAHVSLDRFEIMLMMGQVANVTIYDNDLQGTAPGAGLTTSDGNPTAFFRVSAPRDANGNWSFIQWVMTNRNGAAITVDSQPDVLSQIIVPLIPWLLIFGFIWFFVFRQLRKQGIRQQPIPVYQVAPPEPTGAMPL